MVRVRIAKRLRKRRVFHVARYRHHVWIHSAQPLQRESVGFARGNFRIRRIVRRWWRGEIRRRGQRRALVRFSRIRWYRRSAAQFLNRRRKLFLRKRLSVPI